MTALRFRGVVEGFYGPVWTATQRRLVARVAAAAGANAWLYGPKHDQWLRERWRDPTPPEVQASLIAELDTLARLGLRPGCILGPSGLDGSRLGREVASAVAKLEPLVDAGLRWVVIGFDDLLPTNGDGSVHGRFAAALHELLVARAVHIDVVPRHYVGTNRSRYLDELCPLLPGTVAVGWTGPKVVAPAITAADLAARREATGRDVWLWDNVPVNDGPMEPLAHQGPYCGREPALAGGLRGVVSNPAVQAPLALVGVAAAMTFWRDPVGVDTLGSWHEAIAAAARALGVTDEAAFAAVCDALSWSPLSGRPPGTVEALVAAVVADPGRGDALRALHAALERDLHADRHLDGPDVEAFRPWLRQLHRDARAGLRAVEVLAAVAAGSVADEAVAGLQIAWQRARAGGPVVYGPRLACYPTGGTAGDKLAAGLDAAEAARRGAASTLGSGVEGGSHAVEQASPIDQLARLALGAALHLGHTTPP